MSTELPVYLGPDGREHRNPWVSIVFFQGEQYDDPDLNRLLTAEWLDHQAIADYLAQWDFGTETDQAHTTDEDPRTADRWADVIDVEIAPGHEYVLTTNRGLSTYSLSRRPLDYSLLEFAHGGHELPMSGAWHCDTCNSPYCELID